MLLLLYTQVFLRVQFLALYFSPCIISLCQPLLIHTLSHTIYLLMTYNYRCQLFLIQYPSFLTMQSYICDVIDWATANMPEHNDNKTEVMLVTYRRTKYLHDQPTSITIGNAQIPFKQSVRNLVFTLDCILTMNAHNSNIARTC